LISQFLSDPENPELIQALLNFIQTEIAAAREIAPQIRALIFNYLVQAMQMLAEEISLEQTIASPKLHLVSAESPMISAAPEGIAAEHQAALLAAAGHLLKVVSQENTSREEFQKAYRAFLETAAAANLKISLENYIRGYIYAGILLSANGAAKSDLIAEMDTVSAQSRSSTNPRVVADINKGETGADIARGDFEAVSDSSHESAFFICGVVHRLLESQKAKAERIIGVLHNNPLVWEKMLDHVENQRIERVIDFVNNLLYTARSMVAPTAGENPHQAGYVYSKPVLEAALAKVAGGANPQAAALAA
jgi:hypothetical protein